MQRSACTMYSKWYVRPVSPYGHVEREFHVTSNLGGGLYNSWPVRALTDYEWNMVCIFDAMDPDHVNKEYKSCSLGEAWIIRRSGCEQWVYELYFNEDDNVL